MLIFSKLKSCRSVGFNSDFDYTEGLVFPKKDLNLEKHPDVPNLPVVKIQIKEKLLISPSPSVLLQDPINHSLLSSLVQVPYLTISFLLLFQFHLYFSTRVVFLPEKLIMLILVLSFVIGTFALTETTQILAW